MTQSTSRIEEIDILRGFTLLGIILVHMVEQYYAGAWPEKFTTVIQGNIADQIASGFVGILITGKFYMIFSFLFGVSFFLQFSKSGSETNFLVRFTWRLVILFVIGFIHHLHYRGDILTIYALLGFALLLFYRLQDRYLIWVAIFFMLNVPSFIIRGIHIFFPSENASFFNQDQDKLLAYYNAVKAGHYVEILRANLHEFIGKMQFQVESGRLYITMGLFLIGIYAGRKEFFKNLSQKIPLLKRMIRFGLFTLAGCIIFSATVFGTLALLKIQLPDAAGWMIGGFVFDIFNSALATIYVALILLLCQKERWIKVLSNLYPVGRMGLTTYLMQTLFGTLIFFSYGFGLLGEIGALTCFGLALALFYAQIVFAKFWFNYFLYGPVEWLWRNLTYFKIYPMKAIKINTLTS